MFCWRYFALFLVFVVGHSAAAAEVAILFEAYVDNNWEICRVDPDGKNRKNITSTPNVHELYPQASPDGSRIAFLVDSHDDGKITRSLYVMNADGSGRQKVTDGARHCCWSPDGRELAFPRQEFSKFRIKDYVTKGIHFYDVASGATTQHPNTKIEHLYVPTWSADGKWIVSTVHGGMGFGHAIIAIEVEGDRVVDLKISGCRPCLSSDSKRLTWSSDDHTVNVAEVEFSEQGPRLRDVRVLYKHAKMHLYHPDFSPDGNTVTFSMGPGGRQPAKGPGTQAEVAEMTGVRGPWDIYLKRVDSDAEPTRVTFDPTMSNKESEWTVVQ